jgi:hypothetical protein
MPTSEQRAMRVGRTLILAQLVAMLVFSSVQYGRYGLTNDFAGYAQAWTAIAHGHLDPWVSVFGVHFLRNNLDLAMYPLAPLAWVYPHPVVLSWAHDAAVVATELVALAWARDVLERNGDALGRRRDAVLLAVAVLLAANPWSWETIALPLHFEPFAALFAVLAGRDLWRGRTRRLWLWVPLCMGAEALGSVYVVAVGLAAVAAGRATRRGGAALLASGGAGLVAVLGLGLVGRGGATLAGTYGYLGVGAHSGAPGLVGAVLTHPGTAAAMLGSHAGYVLGYVLAGGALGLASPLGAAAVLLIIVPNALSGQLAFIAFPGAFQSWPAEPFLTVASVMVVCRLAQSARAPQARRVVGAGAVALVTAALTLALADVSSLSRRWVADRRTADQLALVDRRAPAGAEVVAPQDLIGRLAVGRQAYAYYRGGQPLPVVERRVVVVLQPRDSADQAAAVRRLRRAPGTRTLVSGDRITALLVRPRPGERTLTV